MKGYSPRKNSPHKKKHADLGSPRKNNNPWIRAARDLERLKERSLSTGSATTDCSALDTPRTPYQSPRMMEEQIPVDFFEHMKTLEGITEQDMKLMKLAYSAGEKYFEEKKKKHEQALRDLRVEEAFESFMINNESTLVSRVTSRNVHVDELDFHVQKSRTMCLNPTELRSGSKIVGFYGALTGSYKQFRSSEERLRVAAERSKMRMENDEPEPYDYLLDETYMIRHPKHEAHEVWVECHIIAVDTSGMLPYIRALPCMISKLKSKTTIRTFPKKIKESTCFWVPFTESWVQERDQRNYESFIRVNSKFNEWVRQDNTEDLRAVRELRKKKKLKEEDKKGTEKRLSIPKNKRTRSKSFEAAERWTHQVTQPHESGIHSSTMFLSISGGTKKQLTDDNKPEYPSPASMHDVPWIELHGSSSSSSNRKKKRKINDGGVVVVCHRETNDQKEEGKDEAQKEKKKKPNLSVIIPPPSTSCFVSKN
jgi:hypothetical protein